MELGLPRSCPDRHHVAPSPGIHQNLAVDCSKTKRSSHRPHAEHTVRNQCFRWTLDSIYSASRTEPQRPAGIDPDRLLTKLSRVGCSASISDDS